MTTIPQLADLYLTAFGIKQRDTREYYFIIDETFDKYVELMNLIKTAHGEMLPDDTKYKMVHDALSVISDMSNDAEFDDIYGRLIEHEGPVYNHELLKWISSNLTRAEYVNQAVQDYCIESKDFDLYKALTLGYCSEFMEVAQTVLSILQETANDIEEENDDAE